MAAGVIAFAGFGLNWLGGQAEDTSAGSTAAEHAAPAADRAAPMLAGSAPPAEIRHSGVDYTRQTLTQIAAAWSAPPQPVSGSGGPAAEMNSLKGDLGRLLAPDLLLACLDAIAQENGDGPITAQIVDYATFEGAPALIVQFSADNGIWAWAVGPECGTRGAGAASLARLPVR